MYQRTHDVCVPLPVDSNVWSNTFLCSLGFKEEKKHMCKWQPGVPPQGHKSIFVDNTWWHDKLQWKKPIGQHSILALRLVIMVAHEKKKWCVEFCTPTDSALRTNKVQFLNNRIKEEIVMATIWVTCDSQIPHQALKISQHTSQSKGNVQQG